MKEKVKYVSISSLSSSMFLINYYIWKVFIFFYYNYYLVVFIFYLILGNEYCTLMNTVRLFKCIALYNLSIKNISINME